MEPKFKTEKEPSQMEKYEIEFLQKIEEQIKIATEKIPEEKRDEIEGKIHNILATLSLDLCQVNKVILTLKLTQYFEKHDTIDVDILRGTILETRNYLRGSLESHITTYRNKTSKKNQQNTRERMKIEDDEEFNPYITLFETSSGDYYLARLLNHPHLVAEGEMMHHCISASSSADSYIYRMQGGEIDTFSLRKKEDHQSVTTIEYNRNKKSLTQLKKNYEAKVLASDPFFNDLTDALLKLEETVDEIGRKRTIDSVYREASEDIKVEKNHLCSERGEIPYEEYTPELDHLVLSGNIETTAETTEEELVFISRIPTVVTNLSHLKQELKDTITNWAGSIKDEGSNVFYPNLETVYGYLDTPKAWNIEMPKIQNVGQNFDAGKAKKFELPLLESVGGLLNAFSSEVFIAPSLLSVDGPLVAPKANTFEAPILKKVKRIDLSKKIAEENIHIPKAIFGRVQKQ